MIIPGTMVMVNRELVGGPMKVTRSPGLVSVDNPTTGTIDSCSICIVVAVKREVFGRGKHGFGHESEESTLSCSRRDWVGTARETLNRCHNEAQAW